MNATRAALPLVLALVLGVVARADGQRLSEPDTVVVHNGALELRALLWRPSGRGPFPAILFNHGSGRSRRDLERLGPYEQQAAALGSVFAGHGFVFLYLFRRGVGLSADKGTSSVTLMDSAFAAKGHVARNALQLQLLQTTELSDARAGLAFLRKLPEVDERNVAVVGHSFGSSLTLLLVSRDSGVRAAVLFSGSAASWEHSPQLRARLLAAADRTTVPIFIMQAANDYSVAPAAALDAEMTRLGKPHQVKIYPPVGQTPDAGHGFIYSSVPLWEGDVFAFLRKYLRQ
jgi:carboxymethylenebutenolidase